MTKRTSGEKKAQLPAKMTQKNETPEVSSGVAEKPDDQLQKLAVVDGVMTITGTDEAQRRLGAAMGSDCVHFQSLSLGHLLNIIPEKTKQDGDYTFEVRAAVSMLEGIGPTDTLEGMLAAQMVATHHLSMMTMRKAVHSSSPDVRQANANLATKFSRTFVAQMEALGKHRRNGEQVVRHLQVNEGGQAVIANTVTTGGSGK